MIEFEWDPKKAAANVRKHHVAFREAATIFKDPMSMTVGDPDHSQEEERFITIGLSTAGRVLIVSHTDRGDRIRIINARELTRAEREAYEDEIQQRRS